MTQPTNDKLTQTPADLVAIEAAVSRAAAADRRSAPVTLEDRLFASTVAHLSADRPSDEAPGVIAVIGPSRSRQWRLAASIAVVSAGVLGSVWLANRGTVQQPREIPVAAANLEADLKNVNAELESLMMIDVSTSLASSDDSSTLDAELAALENELSGLGLDESTDSFWEESL